MKKTCLSQAVPTPKPEVLFVDDEQVVLDGIRRALVEMDVDWEIAFFDNPHAVLDAPQAMSCKVIVTDLRMPDMNGLELLERLRAKGMEAEAIILTGTGDMASALEAINNLRVFRYYTKPYPSSRLVEGIADAIRQREGTAVQTVVADRLSSAVLALDAAKRIGFMNKEGAKLVAAGAVLFADAAGRCRASTPQQTAMLHRSIDKVLTEGEPTVLAMMDAAGERQYSILVDRDDNGRADSVLLFVQDIHRYPIPSVDNLRRLFDFSGSEAKLAHELAAGFDLKEAAKRVGISVQTARTYLKILFGKTRTKRQAELVRLFVTAMPPTLSDGNDPPSDYS
ncbi:MAG: response regulator [Phaeospirillum sp.]|nr:response regulator [Phaeospirillum sp.]